MNLQLWCERTRMHAGLIILCSKKFCSLRGSAQVGAVLLTMKMYLIYISDRSSHQLLASVCWNFFLGYRNCDHLCLTVCLPVYLFLYGWSLSFTLFLCICPYVFVSVCLSPSLSISVWLSLSLSLSVSLYISFFVPLFVPLFLSFHFFLFRPLIFFLRIGYSTILKSAKEVFLKFILYLESDWNEKRCIRG